MALTVKCKAFIRITIAFIKQPRLIIKTLIQVTRAFYRQPQLVKAFIQQPQLSLELLAQLPEILRGFNYSREWQPPAVDNISLSFFDSPLVSHSNTIKSYFDNHKEGKGIWKWSHYFDIYHRHFKKFVGREVHVLEIGIYSGGSLEMWRDYLGPKCHVYGVDIQEACKVYENEYTKIFIGDQSDRKFWKLFKNNNLRVDILIDDGGHQPEQQIVTFEEMLSHLSPGGVYLCEDIHGLHNAFASYLHGLIKNLNEMNAWPIEGVKPTQFQSWIKSIHFYPYVTVIEKAEKPEEKFIAPKHGTEWQPFL